MIQNYFFILILNFWNVDFSEIQGKWMQSNDEGIAKSVLDYLYIIINYMLKFMK